jgi:hypothetical protein
MIDQNILIASAFAPLIALWVYMLVKLFSKWKW